ncbi:metallophosphoesterase family protein [Changchengzhania lutea]|uniref:metallophosphoesterase family protein n=1 Tax=Changchengzhania lutea TaxID=2049305 RepID=UPI00163DE2B9|nr:metallophosphoesterase family protein [Changchengzhania lutea]
MRTLVIGDIHGGMKALVQLMDRLELRPNDKLIFLGDYVDGWSEASLVIRYLIRLSQTHDCVFIKGNHDVWCENWLKTGDIDPIWHIHGGKETIASYTFISAEEKETHLNFFEKMPLYHINADMRLFIHAGFTSMHGVTKEVFKPAFYFDRTLWEMALTMDKGITEDSTLYPNRLKHYKEIYIGHTPTINFDCYVPMNAANVWNVDTGAAFYGKLSGIDLDTKKVFQSDIVKDLYPNEKGRNKS